MGTLTLEVPNQWTSLRTTLGRTRIFTRLSEPQLTEVAILSREREFPEGREIYRLGQRGEALYVLITGAVGVFYGTQPNPIRLTAEGSPYEVFGWVSVVRRKSRRVATAISLTRTIVLEISGGGLIALMEQDHDIGFSIMREVNSFISSEFKALAAG